MQIYDIVVQQKKTSLVYNDFDSTHYNKITPNVVDNLCVNVQKLADGSDVVFLDSDVSLLFNQERLNDTLGRDGIKHFFDSLSSRSVPLSELRSKISDEDLACICKSRYLQQPSEILAWSEYLNNNYSDLMAQISDRTSSSEPHEEPKPSETDPSSSNNE
ncbi:hypothetical protein [Microvirus sp.]|nr:hypothetical protein [Microvirus sp.]